MPYGFVPKGDREAFGQHMQKAGHQTAIQSDEPARDYSASANPRHGATKTHAAVRLNTPAAKAHAKKFPGFTTSVNEVDEGWVSVNGQRVGPRRQPMSFAQRVAAKGGERTPEQKAATEKALKRIEDKITVATGPKRSAEIDADLKKKRNAELTAAGRKPLPESDNKSRNIAKAVMGKKKVAENPELDKLVAREEIELEDGNVIEIDIELAEAIADLFDSLDDDDQDALAEMLHTDIDSFMEVVDFIENDGE
jgi:hypothetical protein